MRLTFALKVFASVSTAALFSIHPAAAQRMIIDLGTLRTDSSGTSDANAINNNGNVVGVASTNSGSQHAYLTAPNMPINPATDDLGTFPGGSTSVALGVNVDSNGGAQAVGQGDLPQPSSGPVSLAFRGGPPIQGLAPLQDGSDHVARGINSAGKTVGRAIRSTDSSFRAVSWDGGITDLNNLLPADSPWMLTDATGINDTGQIVGGGINNGVSHAFLLDSGVTDLGIWPGTVFSFANGINATGSVVGFSAGGSFPAGVAFIWDNVNGMQSLGMLSGDTGSQALGINNAGQVVGVSINLMTGVATAVLWASGTSGTIIDLNTLIPPGSGWQLAVAKGINDSGQIVGIGLLNGQPRGWLMP